VSLILIIALLLPACDPAGAASTQAGGPQLNGYLLLWHDWTGPESSVLNNLLDQFQQLHPGVTVISMAVPSDQLVQSFTSRVAAGLGPDLVLADAGLVYQLAQAGVLRDVGGRTDIDTSLLQDAALSEVRAGHHLWGLPFALHTQVLYYNTALVKSVPATLNAWMAQASNQEKVAFDTNLAQSFWGVGDFGGSMFNDQGEWVLDRGGFVNWIDALKALQATPGFIMGTDSARLLSLFESGQAAFYIGYSRDLPQLQETLGADKLSLATLPGGPNDNPARPILQTDAFAFNRVSSPQETGLAVALATFMTSLQQQTRLTVDPIGRLPVHTQVRYRQTLSPLVTALAMQSRTAVPISFERRPVWNGLSQGESEISSLYMQALAGIKPSNQVVEQISAKITAEFNLQVSSVNPKSLCPALKGGVQHQVTLWHSLQKEEAGALDQIANNFMDVCTGVSLQLSSYNPDQIGQKYKQALSSGSGPDMLLASSRLTPQLAEAGLIQDLTNLVDPTYLQQFIPAAESALRYQGGLYGLPTSVAVQALYYNTDLVKQPLLNLNEVPVQITLQRQFALPAGFSDAYWGLAPFGGFEFNGQTGQVQNDRGLLNWLNWLLMARNQPGMGVTTDFAMAEDLFASGQAAYFVGGPTSLSRLRSELGRDKFGVTLLPAGPEGPAGPVLQVQGVMINPNNDKAATDIALAFAKYLATPESQRILLQTGTYVSAVVTVDLTNFPQLNGFREQAKVSSLLIETPDFTIVEKLGDQLFREVLNKGAEPAQAVKAFKSDLAQAINGLVTGQ
jgi:arabinogalactan oligomer/maltooligosaccharide transport system substrate-binding protein